MFFLKNIIFFASIFLSTLVMATEHQTEPQKYNNYQEFLNLYGVNEVLMKITGEDFERLSTSFDQTTNITPLKGGGAFIEGWRKNQEIDRKSILIIHPYGDLSAALYDKKTNEIRYYSSGINKSENTVFNAWVEILSPVVLDQKMTPSQFTKKSPWDNLNNEESLRKISSLIWDYEGAKITHRWNMNRDVQSIVVSAVNEINECTKRVWKIYMPAKIIDNGIDLFAQAQDIINFISAVATKRRSEACITTTAARWRSPIEMASLGI